MAIVTTAQLAKIFDVEPRWIQRLVSEHGMPRAAPGKFDLLTCVRWYVRHLREALQARSTGEGSDLTNLTAERTRQLRAQNERTELLMAEQRGELIEWREIKVLHDGFMALLVQGTEAAPQRITGDPELQKKVAAEMLAMRRAWADWWAAQAAEVQQASVGRAKRRKA